MDLSNMTLEEVISRIAELDEEVRGLEDVEEINKRTEEKKALKERKAELEAIEEREKAAKELEQGAIAKVVEREDREMPQVEVRNTQDYINAYAEYVKTGKDEECRSLLTENGEGTIAIPDLVLDVVKTAWDKDTIMSKVAKMGLKGNLKVNFEISGDDAIVHTEGGSAIAEETLTEGIATLVPAYIKKWIAISDEVMSLRGTAFLNYIYSELTYRIVKKMADVLVGKIAALPTSATATSPNAAQVTSAPAMALVASAIANLSDEAQDPVVIMNKLTWSEFKSIQYANGYGVDPFEGLEVCFNNTLPAYASADAGAVYMIVGDLGQGAMANFPNGDAVEFTFDPYTKKTSDLVEVLGKEYVGLGVVACKAFTNIVKPVSA